MIDVEHTTSERIWAAIRTPRDPTASLPQWSITEGGIDDPDTFHDGRWVSAWDSRNHRIEVESPLLGSGQTLPIAPDLTYTLWLRVGTGDEDPVRRVGTIRGR